MKTKILFGTILTVFILLGIMPMLQSQELIHQELYDGLNFWGKVGYFNAKGFLFFTTQGTVRHCGYNDPLKCSGNPEWCGQPDSIIERPNGTTFHGDAILDSICPSDRKKGTFLDFYFYDGSFLEKELPKNPETGGGVDDYTLPKGAAVEVYCCECYTDCSKECEDGDKQNYVCNPNYWNRVYYSYCDDGIWEDRYDVCPSGKSCDDGECITNECTPGETICKSSSVEKVCGDNARWKEIACFSGQTCSNGVCEDDNETPGNFGTPVYSDKLSDATGQMWLDAQCIRSSDCKQIVNYTVSCSGNDNILKIAREKIANDYPDCSSCLSFFGNLQNLWYWISGSKTTCISECGPIKSIKDKWIQLFGSKNDPKGFCIAESSVGYCQYVQWASLGILDKNNKCNDGLYTILIGVVVLGFIIVISKK